MTLLCSPHRPDLAGGASRPWNARLPCPCACTRACRGHVSGALHTHAQPATSCSSPRPRSPSACTMLPSAAFGLASLACLGLATTRANERCTSRTCKPSGCHLNSFNNQTQANLCAHARAWPRQARLPSKLLQHHASLLYLVARAHFLQCARTCCSHDLLALVLSVALPPPRSTRCRVHVAVRLHPEPSRALARA